MESKDDKINRLETQLRLQQEESEVSYYLLFLRFVAFHRDAVSDECLLMLPSLPA